MDIWQLHKDDFGLAIINVDEILMLFGFDFGGFKMIVAYILLFFFRKIKNNTFYTQTLNYHTIHFDEINN